MRLAQRTASDTSLRDDAERVVVVAPHPDDEVLACGLLLATAAERGVPVTVIAVTDGEAAYPGYDAHELARVRCAEQHAALAEVGVPHTSVRRLGLADGAVGLQVDELAEAIRSACTIGTLLVAPSVHDWHPDHEACGVAARSAARTVGIAHWSSLFWAHHHPQALIRSRPRLLRFDGSARHVEARRRAVECHRSQFAHPREGGSPILTPADVAHLDERWEMYVEEPRG